MTRSELERRLRCPGSILLETRRNSADENKTLLFEKPTQIIQTSSSVDVAIALAQVDEAIADGLWVAGYIAYEAGLHFCLPQVDFTSKRFPLLWFGVYNAPTPIRNPSFGEGAVVQGSIRHTLDQQAYTRRIDKARQYIRDGDVYQINFTYPVEFGITGQPLDLYSGLRRAQRVAYSAFLTIDEERALLSFSPELFFRKNGNRIVTRPMKGTIRRGLTSEQDIELAIELQTDAKNQAENLMIVDLLRNDLARISRVGSVEVTGLFQTQVFDTVIQMESSVEAELEDRTTLGNIFEAIFPCGSVTGAPKIRAMQIINELELESRGPYCGAIGYGTPDGDAVFNVAIRTVEVTSSNARMPIGSGIVWDSIAEAEYVECRVKARFLSGEHRIPTDFAVIESLRWDNQEPIHEQTNRIAAHARRMESSAKYFGLPFDFSAFVEKIRMHGSKLAGVHKIRVSLSQTGALEITTSALATDEQAWAVAVVDVRVSPTNVFLYHKTNVRDIYRQALADARKRGATEAILLNTGGYITEGSRTNIFLRQGSTWKTPAVEHGLLKGLERTKLIRDLPAVEASLTVDDLYSADEIILCNSVRGIISAELGPTVDTPE